MPDLFEYAMVRVMPRVDRGECVNVGVLLWCQAANYLGSRCLVDQARLVCLDPFVDLDAVAAHLTALRKVCAGGPDAGPAARLSGGERFRWLTAPRSTVVQTSPVHTGFTDDPPAELDRLVELLVAPPGPIVR
ncbi:hypothetical protein CcI49_00220 [Frankia sp. CcI49]|uniref:DUF3037 domain-containing protein n=1 Tax=unclassified Frankia TaxID=2632575 RepID=UPI0006CA12C2|nr:MULTISPECIES: DUF3037 domain-containing protein [unclassified Frankia]KPM56639.1 hypothetical protein ACG83_01675 [Frankia sp. R43]ONH62535.1 hypothetical protein CcI49_00220 [Frankia sp. CcI49]